MPHDERARQSGREDGTVPGQPQIFREDDELFTETSWAAVMLGQGISMDGHNPMADTLEEPKLSQEIDEMEKSIRFVVDNMPSHQAYLARYCPAERV